MDDQTLKRIAEALELEGITLEAIALRPTEAELRIRNRRWSADAEAVAGTDVPEKAVFHFPGGLKDYLEASLGSEQRVTANIFAGKSERPGGHGSVEWAITWHGGDGFVNSYCNTIPTPEGGTHEAGFWAAILKGIKAYGELAGNKKAGQITREDLMTGGCALVSCFIADPAFVGQTKDRLSTEAAAKMNARPAMSPGQRALTLSR